ncbi:acyl-CoA N-acyltransferase [Rhexocercosporidium sp. MPI-PUGE-AT-0058]|nr:acyl-CoA N-acyltransferase [Rhexocercosporidium sp. MPI-PUGE-AT-0058]
MASQDELQSNVEAMSGSTWFIETRRLLLRSFNPSDPRELHAYEQIYRDPSNNIFSATDTPWLRGEALLEDIIRMWQQGQIKLMIILRTNNPTPGMAVEGGELIGDIELNYPRDGISAVAGCIHWTHTGNRQGYGREAFHAVFDHAFRSIYRTELCLETKVANAPFRAMMERLGLAPLETRGRHWMNNEHLEESVTYTFNRATWEAAKLAKGLPSSP